MDKALDLFCNWVYTAHRYQLAHEKRETKMQESRRMAKAAQLMACANDLRRALALPVAEPHAIDHRRSSESEDDYRRRVRSAL